MVPASSSSTRTWRALQHGHRVVAGLRIAVGIRQQRAVGLDELQPVPPVGQQPLQRRGARAQRRRTEQEGLLFGLLVLVEQHHHQAGAAAEPTEQRALADPGGGGDVVHGDRVGAALGDQSARRVQQQHAVAGGVAPLLRHLAGHRQPLSWSRRLISAL